MIKIDRSTYDKVLQINPMLVKRTKNGYYLLRKNKWLKVKGNKKKRWKG